MENLKSWETTSALSYPKLWIIDILWPLKYQDKFQIKWIIVSYVKARFYFLAFYGIKIIERKRSTTIKYLPPFSVVMSQYTLYGVRELWGWMRYISDVSPPFLMISSHSANRRQHTVFRELQHNFLVSSHQLYKVTDYISCWGMLYFRHLRSCRNWNILETSIFSSREWKQKVLGSEKSLSPSFMS